MTAGAALGLVPHTGWAWLVRVEGAQVQARARVVACDVLAGELYHQAAERDDAPAFLAERRAAAVMQASEAIAAHAEGARTAVVVGKHMQDVPLERILAAHPLIHAAEGELWRAIFAEACAAHGLRVVRAGADELREQLLSRHGEAALASFLAEGKRTLGAPWTREVQDASLAAFSAQPRR